MNPTIVEIGQDFAVQSDGGIVAKGFPSRDAAEEYVDMLLAQTVSIIFDEPALAQTASIIFDELAGEASKWSWMAGGGTGYFTELNAITVVFDYPLTKDARFEFKSENAVSDYSLIKGAGFEDAGFEFKSEPGFTRGEFVECVRAGYCKLYAKDGRAWA